MPQMSPMNWLILFMYFIVMIVVMVSFIYFIFSLKPSNLIINNPKNNYNWMW